MTLYALAARVVWLWIATSLGGTVLWSIACTVTGWLAERHQQRLSDTFNQHCDTVPNLYDGRRAP